MQNLILVIDIGNTNTTIGIFENDKLIDTVRIASDIIKTDDEYGILISNILSFKSVDNVDGAIISSVVPQLGETFKSAIKKYLNITPISLSHKSKMPVYLKLDNNSEIGADRIANAVGALKYSLPAIVIDFGTATTFDIIDENKNFIGGIIAPGVEIQARALSKYTSKLPKLKIETPKNSIGKNTIDAMLSGIVSGHRCMIEGMIKNCASELNQKPTVIATGGYSKVIFDNNLIDYIDKDLTLYGLKELYYLNKD